MLMIFSLPRCGSTNFVKLLNLAQGDGYFDEPFHEAFLAQWTEHPPQTAAELPEALRALARQWRGFKHVWQTDGWPFAAAEMNFALLEQNLDVILLTRRNILQRVVSSQMCIQVGIWHPDTPEIRQEYDTHRFQELDLTHIDWMLRNEPILLQECRHRLQRHGRRWIEIAYEDLYDADPDTRWATFKQALDFAGIALAGGQPAFETLFQSCYRKLNSARTYSHIQGIQTLDLLYGSPVTGYLFDQHSQPRTA